MDPQAVLALLLCVAIAKPVGDNAAEEVDADDLQPAAQFYPGYYNGGFGGFGGFGGYGGHGGYYRKCEFKCNCSN